MHLSQLTLNWRSRQARRDLSDPYEMHRTLARSFVRSSDQVPPRFLWRLEPTRFGADPLVIIQSAQAPDFSPFEGLGGYLSRQAKSKYVDLGKLISTGAAYRFRLVANPTVTREGKRRGIVGEADQIAWLKRQGKRHGFDIESALVITSEYIKSRKVDQLISLGRVHYEGVMRILDAEPVGKVLLGGMGPGKALGCGLLSLAPVQAT